MIAVIPAFKQSPRFVDVSVLCIDELQSELIGTGFLLAAESAQSEIGHLDTQTGFVIARRDRKKHR